MAAVDREADTDVDERRDIRAIQGVEEDRITLLCKPIRMRLAKGQGPW